MITVIEPGPLTTVQDLGRPGYAHLGVPRAGAADRASLRLGNRLVGNREQAAALEVTLGGIELETDERLVVALTGGRAEATVDGDPVAMNVAHVLRPGARLQVGPVRDGLRVYLAVRGGVDVEPVLGSRSTDTLSGLGPARLARGDRLPVGTDAPGQPWYDVVPTATPDSRLELRVRLGPRDDAFTEGSVQTLLSTTYAVTADSDRTGLRLDGPALQWARNDELPSEGMVCGALQVPADGKPILFLSNHPTTGGYPVIAVVAAGDLAAAGQARPGTHVRFRTRA
jgi:biotin-dependent carboxylase-like uncharacterized protein